MVRLLELRIRNFRGVRHLDLNLAGESAAILGPNGSGKSSVVDALDFLLTGRIDRLTGQGTGAVSLGKHGPHLASDARSASVEADFACDGAKEPYSVRRSVLDAERLQSLTEGAMPESLVGYLALAQGTKLHLLTRRQILAFILAEPGKRSELVAALLRTEDVESLRRELQGAGKLAADEAGQLQGAFTAQGKALLRTVAPPAMSPEELLERVNGNRRALGAGPAASLVAADVLHGVPELAQAAADPLQTQRVRDAVRVVATWADGGEAKWLADGTSYEDALAGYRADSAHRRTVRAMHLVKAGRALVDGDQCPLCLTQWDQHALLRHLDDRLREGESALAEAKALDDRRVALIGRLDEVLLVLETLGTSLRESHLAEADTYSSRAAELKRYARLCVVGTSDDDTAPPEQADAARAAVQRIEAVREASQKIAGLVERLPDLTGAQKAWDELHTASRQLAEFTETCERFAKARACVSNLEIVHQSLLAARDEVLQGVYDGIASRLGDFYAAVHTHDKDGFAASIEPTKAGLKLEVGFHRLGTFPPTAVHSEGHQDSMGVCLFLALVEYLASAGAGPLILDDVVMSVDREHRRGVAQVLATHFAATQFLITTHDRVWWHQLRTTGLVKAKGQIAFPSWTFEDGPAVDSGDADFLGDARKRLLENDVPAAAHALRRGFEMAGPELCDTLGATIRYRADGGWSAGEYMDSALARYGRVLKKARSAAQSWKHELGEIDAREAALTAANKALGGERWAVNALVHFNAWADLAPADFEPVLAAHEALFAQYSCPSCQSLLRVVEEAGEDIALRCQCGNVNMNLSPKTK